MKRKLLWLFIAGIAVGIVLSGLYRHFVTDQIMDGGNMENPFSQRLRPDYEQPEGVRCNGRKITGGSYYGTV